jgi:hypothetical protein
VPRKRNKGVTRAMETDILPTNKGVENGTYTKENQWAGPIDQDYGEFYKKMNLNEKRVAKEATLFYGLFSVWRKLAFSISLVFYDQYFKVQAGS